jgi:hypothetical protein
MKRADQSPHSSSQPSSTASRLTRKVSGWATFAVACGAFTLLIWMKLRVVGSVPRTAYADPDHPVPPPAKTLPLPSDIKRAREEARAQERAAHPSDELPDGHD